LLLTQAWQAALLEVCGPSSQAEGRLRTKNLGTGRGLGAHWNLEQPSSVGGVRVIQVREPGTASGTPKWRSIVPQGMPGGTPHFGSMGHVLIRSHTGQNLAHSAQKRLVIGVCPIWPNSTVSHFSPKIRRRSTSGTNQVRIPHFFLTDVGQE
jgi:hypothetical protein